MTTLTGSPALLNQCSHATQLGSPRGPHHVSPLLQACLGRDQEKALRLHVHARSSLLDLGRCFPHPCIKCHKHIVCITGNGLCHGSGIAKCDLVKYTRLQVDVVLAVGVVLCHETRVEIPQAARIAILLVLLEEGVVLQGIGQGTTTFHAKIADNEMQVKAALFLPLPLEQAQDFNCLMSVFSANIVPPLRLSLVVHATSDDIVAWPASASTAKLRAGAAASGSGCGGGSCCCCGLRTNIFHVSIGPLRRFASGSCRSCIQPEQFQNFMPIHQHTHTQSFSGDWEALVNTASCVPAMRAMTRPLTPTYGSDAKLAPRTPKSRHIQLMGFRLWDMKSKNSPHSGCSPRGSFRICSSTQKRMCSIAVTWMQRMHRAQTTNLRMTNSEY